MLTITELLDSYYAVRHERTTYTIAALEQLHQQVAAQLLTIRQQESRFITAQHQHLEQLRPLLASDARVLLTTPCFSNFVEGFLEQTDQHQLTARYSRLLPLPPHDWLLLPLPVALQLHEITTFEPENRNVPSSLRFAFRMQVQGVWAEWQQLLVVVTQPALPWYEAFAQLEQQILKLPLTAALRKAMANGVATAVRPVLEQLRLLLYVALHVNLELREFACFTFVETRRPL